MKFASYNKKFNTITYWVQSNVSETVSCYTAKQAAIIIKSSQISQTLKTA